MGCPSISDEFARRCNQISPTGSEKINDTPSTVKNVGRILQAAGLLECGPADDFKFPETLPRGSKYVGSGAGLIGQIACQ